MIRVTIKEALEREDKETVQCIYSYHEDNITFYVGRSIHPMQRLKEHMGKYPPLYMIPDAIGLLILENRPISLNWIIEIHRVEETAPDLYRKLTPEMVARKLEEQVIINLKPCLNATNTYERTPLPERYVKYQNANENITMPTATEEEIQALLQELKKKGL